ncbi:hypothetical protein [Bradyrhizobium sp. ORS 86]|uniref:hypothetical protein n=1 Tax=Bradyrhizobium sp. ORS 86 TaxID=1685970 RepID=UPI00388F866E
MPITRKPIEISPETARQFRVEMRAFHAEQSPIRRDEIAARVRHMLLQDMPSGSKLRLSEVLELFELMR